MQISVIIPMYNENKIIADTARQLSEYMAETFDSYEILFSDDGSADGCGDTVDALGLPFVRVIRYKENQGKGAAVRRGMLEAQGDLVLFTDADLAYGVEVIGAIWNHDQSDTTEGKVIIGSRAIHPDGYSGYTPLRRLMSKVYVAILGLVGGFRLSDSQCGCKAFSQKAAKEIFRRCEVNGFSFDFEAILWAEKLGFPIAEFPVRIVNHRESKIHVLRDSVRMLRSVRKIRNRVRKQSV